MIEAKQTRHSANRTWLFAEQGQALIETAIVFPLLILMLLGTAELARVAYAAIEVANAAKAAVAYGAQNIATSSDTTGIQTAAVTDAGDLAATLTTISTVTGACSNPAILCSGPNSTCTNSDCSDAGDHIENILTVTTSASFDPLIHLPGIPTTYPLHGLAVQKVLPR